MYDKKKTWIYCVLFVALIAIFGFVFSPYLLRSGRSENVNRTIQELEEDNERATRTAETADKRLSDAQDTAERLSRRSERNENLLEQLSEQLEEIARANGLTE
jgi:TolA-binding protein